MAIGLKEILLQLNCCWEIVKFAIVHNSYYFEVKVRAPFQTIKNISVQITM